MVDTTNGDAQQPVELTIRDGGEACVVYSGGDRPFTIGRTEACDVVLKTQEASRKHAMIVREGDQFVLIDNASSNGTRLNGRRVDRGELHPGDVIQIGKALIVFGRSPSDAEDIGAPTEEEITASPEHVSAPPREARPPAAVFRRRASISSYVFFFMLLGTVALGVYYLKSLWSTHEGRSGRRETVTGTPSAQRRESSGVPPSTDLAPEPETVLARILPTASREKIGWEILEHLEELADTHPDPRVVRHAQQLHDLLEAVRSAEEEERTLDLEGALQNVVYGRRFGEALALARLLASAAIKEKTSVFWKDRAARIERTAQEQFKEVDRRVTELLQSGKERRALQELVGVRDTFSGMAFYELLLDRVTKNVLTPSPSQPQPSSASGTQKKGSAKAKKGRQHAESKLPWGQEEKVVVRIVVTKKIEGTVAEDRVRWSRLARLLLSGDPPFAVRPFGDSTAKVDYVLRVDLVAKVLREHRFYDAIPISREWEGRARCRVMSARLDKELHRLDGKPAKAVQSAKLKGGELTLDKALDLLIERLRRTPGFRLSE